MSLGALCGSVVVVWGVWVLRGVVVGGGWVGEGGVGGGGGCGGGGGGGGGACPQTPLVVLPSTRGGHSNTRCT